MNIMVAGSKTYTFRHALLGEAVYDDLLPGERVRLHGQYVAALAAGGRGTAAEMARHARRAMDFDRAATAGIEAGDEAVSVGGPDEAARHYEHALELLEDADRAERLGIEVSKVVVWAADAHSAAGDSQRAAESARRAHRAAPRRRAGDGAGPAAQQLRPRAVHHRDDARPDRGHQPGARPRAGGREPAARQDPRHARAGPRRASQRLEEAENAATEALALAERLAMPVLASEVVTTLSSLRFKRGDGTDSDAVRAALQDAVTRAVEAGAIYAELRALFLLGRSHQEAAEWDEAARWFATGLERGVAVGLPWAPYSLESRWQLGWVRYAQGEWDAALDLVAIADDESGPLIPRALIEATRLSILSARGRAVGGELRRLRKVWPDEGSVAVFSAGTEIEMAGSRRRRRCRDRRVRRGRRRADPHLERPLRRPGAAGGADARRDRRRAAVGEHVRAHRAARAGRPAAVRR